MHHDGGRASVGRHSRQVPVGRTAGKTAFAGHDRRRTEPQYAWLAQLLRGWTTRQVESFAAAARAENLAAPQGATQRVGTAQVTGWVRYYPQQRDLIRTLRDAGF
ncbi:hypothetical protein ACWCQ0_54925, partial [Streptomyces massasporeus]